LPEVVMGDSGYRSFVVFGNKAIGEGIERDSFVRKITRMPRENGVLMENDDVRVNPWHSHDQARPLVLAPTLTEVRVEFET
jgi:hypothetical protein